MIISKITTRCIGKVVLKPAQIINRSSTVVNSPIISRAGTGITRTNQIFLNHINQIPVFGIQEEEKPILEIFKSAMYDLLAKSKGKAVLPNEIRFEPVRINGLIRKQGVACVTRDNVLHVNRDYLTHIDENIQNNLQKFLDLGLISRQPDGKYKIAKFLTNSKSKVFETRLNEYNKNWPLDYKFKFHRTSMNYYANLVNQVRNFPILTIENIMKIGENQNVLKSCSLFKTRAEISNLSKEKQLGYLKEIFKNVEAQGKKIIVPEDTALYTTQNYVLHHELGHINHNLHINNDQYTKISSAEKISEWKNNSKIQEVCYRVSGYASSQPCEFVAEVFAGLANGQKFHPDVMHLYQNLKGPMIF